MIHYYIPDFFWHYHVNLKLLELMRDEPQMFHDDFEIGAVFGNFPNCIWNGGRPFMSRHVNADEMRAISERFNSFGIPLRLTMTNTLLKKTDCYDRYSNYIMKNLNNGFNQVIVGSSILEEHIRCEYPQYPVVKSILAAENVYYDDSDKYFMSVLARSKNADMEFLKSIENKNKIEILINDTCTLACDRRYEHYKMLNLHQIYENDQCSGLICPYISENRRPSFYTNPLTITREKIKEIYEPIGFQHFKIDGRGNRYSMRIVLDYAHYMVRPEYKEDFIEMMMASIVADNR